MSTFIAVNVGGGTLGGDLDDKYINESGDTMKGDLDMRPHKLFVNVPTANSEAASVGFVLSHIIELKFMYKKMSYDASVLFRFFESNYPDKIGLARIIPIPTEDIDKIFNMSKQLEKLRAEFQTLHQQYRFFESNTHKYFKKLTDTITNLTSQITSFKEVELLGYQKHVETYVSSFNSRIKNQNSIIKTVRNDMMRFYSDITYLKIEFTRSQKLKHDYSNNIIAFEGRIKSIENANNLLNARVGNIETLKYSNLIYELDTRVKKIEKIGFYDLEARIMNMEKVIVFMKQQNTKILNK